MSRYNYNPANFDNTAFGDAIDMFSPGRRRGRATSVPAGTTYIVSNFPATAWAEVVDSGNNATAAANGDAAGGSFVTTTTGTAAADANILVTATAATRRDWNPRIRFRFVTGASIASLRIWVGAFASDPSALATLATISGACFGYDTVVDGTAYWRCRSANATSQQTTATDMPVVASTVYTGEIVMDTTNAQVEFFMASHGLVTAVKTQSPLRSVATHATYVPVATTPLLLGATCTVLATAAAAKSIRVGSIDLSQD